MSKVKITQVRSAINRPERQKLNRPKEHEATPQVLGMIDKVKHLLKVEEIKG